LDNQLLKNYLSKKMPEYMIPTYFIRLEKMPLGASGKLNRKALPNPTIPLWETYLAPSNETEQKLVSIWSEILDLEAEQISVDKNFFDIGGHSLKATRLFYKLQKEFRSNISLTEIFNAPTISAMAVRLLEEDVLEIEDNILTLLKRDHNTDKNLFFIHDGSGDIQAYLKLSELMTGYQCWGIRSATLDHLGPVNLEVQELATLYIEKMKLVQKEGPYTIVGWSLGGIIAFEVAKQLEINGDEVEKIIMIDSAFPTQDIDRPSPFSLEGEEDLLRGFFENTTLPITKAKSLDEFWKKIIPVFAKIENSINGVKRMIPEYMHQMIPHFEETNISALIMHVNTIRSLTQTVDRYIIDGKINTPIILIKASDSTFPTISFTHSEFSVKEIKGNHFSILQEPQIQKLVDELERLLSIE